MSNSILIDPRDSVAVVLEPVPKDRAVSFNLRGETREIAALEDIPVYHKIAVIAIPRGAGVLKYGEEIGVSLRDIRAGEHVHVHNLGSRRRGEGGSGAEGRR